MIRFARPRALSFLSVLTLSVLTALSCAAVAFGDRIPELHRLDPAPDRPDEALEYFLMRRLPEGRDVDLWQRYRAAERRMEKMPRYSSRSGAYLPAARSADPKAGDLPPWEQLGPGNIGGRTRALVIDPTKPDVMYAAGVTGGVWKTLDGGRLWRPLTDLLPNIAVSALLMDPTDPRVLYAGTGEGVYRGLGFRGAGIFKTTDSGRTWERLGATLGPDFRYVFDLAASLRDPRRIYAATRTGVWRSRNGGRTWEQILDPEVRNGCLDLAIRTDRPTDVLFAACGSFEQATIYRHPNAEQGAAWEAVLTEADMGRTSLAIAPSDQDVIYALATSLGETPATEDYEASLHAVFRSSEGGAEGTWEATVRNTDPMPLYRLLLSNAVFAMFDECFDSGEDSNDLYGQGWYDNVIAVDPTEPDVVFTGGIDLFRSDDGGRNWGIISYWFFSPPSAHADQHAIVFHPDYDGVRNRTLFVGNDGGVWRTDNPRGVKANGDGAPCNPLNTRVRWTSLNNSYAVTQFYHGAAFPDGRAYLGGTQDNGTLLGGDAGALNGWREILGGDGGYVAVDPRNPRIVYAETQGLNLLKSTDGGRTFRGAIEGIDEPASNFLFIVPFTMDPRQPRRLWIGGRSLWRTINGAQRWRPASPELDPEEMVSAIAVAPTNPNRVVAGMTGGAVVSTDRALTAGPDTEWTSSVLRRGAFISWLAFDPRDDRVVYATTSTFDGKHVFKSADGGVTWEQIDGNGPGRLPNVPVHSIVVDPADTRRLFVGTDRGVFVSTSGGQRWAVEDNGFTHTIVQAMEIVTRDNGRRYLFAFTHGRGAWRVELGR